MAEVIRRLPKSLRYKILDYCDNIQELGWQFAFYKNPKKALIIAAKNGNVDIVEKCVKLDLTVDIFSEGGIAFIFLLHHSFISARSLFNAR